jgi:hypothetical protein
MNGVHQLREERAFLFWPASITTVGLPARGDVFGLHNFYVPGCVFSRPRPPSATDEEVGRDPDGVGGIDPEGGSN